MVEVLRLLALLPVLRAQLVQLRHGTHTGLGHATLRHGTVHAHVAICAEAQVAGEAVILGHRGQRRVVRRWWRGTTMRRSVRIAIIILGRAMGTSVARIVAITIMILMVVVVVTVMIMVTLVSVSSSSFGAVMMVVISVVVVQHLHVLLAVRVLGAVLLSMHQRAQTGFDSLENLGAVAMLVLMVIAVVLMVILLISRSIAVLSLSLSLIFTFFLLLFL
mmetsp:Transcript_7219/g.12206  ORF Transcript_7219/g.12206 Transcript_7219/m.12206 type:complete len:219 (-) Transcript_7219:2049-2705(-)